MSWSGGLTAVASGTFVDDDGVTQEIIAGVTSWAEGDPDLQRPEVARLFGRAARPRPVAVRSRKPAKPSPRRTQPKRGDPDLPSWWFEPDAHEPVRRSDDELELTARHEGAHAAAAYLLGWEVSWIRMHAGVERPPGQSSGSQQDGYTSLVTPERRDATRALQYATICLAARAHIGWTAEDAGGNAVSYRTDRRQAWRALAGVTPDDPRRTGELFGRAEAYARQLANDPAFRSIAKRVAVVLRERGDLSGSDFNRLAARARSAA